VRSGRFLFVRDSPTSQWIRVELVKMPDCEVWLCRENTIEATLEDEYCFAFNPAETTLTPFNLGDGGELRLGKSKRDFDN